MIVCGTDFSPVANAAANVAASLALRAETPLELVCATGDRSVTSSDGHPGTDRPLEARDALMEAEVTRARQLGVTVTGTLDPALPDQAMTTRARRAETELIVLGSVGMTMMERVLLGSVAERTAMESAKPVLVVRDDAPWEAWAKGVRPLRVMVAFDGGASSAAALAWVAWLRRLGQLSLTACWVVNPATENRRFEVKGEGAGVELLPATRDGLIQEFEARAATGGDRSNIELRLEPTLGRIDSALIDVARSLEADVIVVGSHQRKGFERLWTASVSRGVLRHAPMSVVVVTEK